MSFKWPRPRPINVAFQAQMLKSLYPESQCKIVGTALIWKHQLRPTPFSREYLVRVDYQCGRPPNTRVLMPSLRSLAGDRKIPHVYAGKGDPLCLYYPPANEWTATMHLAETIVPWSCEWLLHFEAWLFSGEWDGGGIHLAPDRGSVIAVRPHR